MCGITVKSVLKKICFFKKTSTFWRVTTNKYHPFGGMAHLSV